jgi:hypothetical protein
MTKHKQLLTIILTITTCYAFGQNNVDTEANKNCKIEIYLVENGERDSTRQCRYCFWPTVNGLADTAFIKDSEIIGYDTTNGQHSLILSKDCLIKLRDITETSKKFMRTAFALVVNGQPIYGGWFLNRNVSNFYACDWIYVFIPFDRDGKGKLDIDLQYPRHQATAKYENDPRNNKLIIECLKKSNRLKTN